MNKQALVHVVNGQNVPNANRWQHEEKEGILTGRMGHGDISSWSRGTTKAQRPIVNGSVKHESNPVQSLADLAAFHVFRRPPRHDPSIVCIPLKDSKTIDRSDVGLMEERAARAANIAVHMSNCFAKYLPKRI